MGKESTLLQFNPSIPKGNFTLNLARVVWHLNQMQNEECKLSCQLRMNTGYTCALSEHSCSNKTYSNLDSINSNGVKSKTWILLGVQP